MKRKFFALALVLLLALPLALAGCNDDKGETYVWTKGEGKLVDLSAAPEGTAEQYQYLYEQHPVATDDEYFGLYGGREYQGHPDSVLLDNGNILVAFPKSHGRAETIMMLSTDGGLTYTDIFNADNPKPDSFYHTEETPTIYKLDFTDGTRISPATRVKDGMRRSPLLSTRTASATDLNGSSTRTSTGPMPSAKNISARRAQRNTTRSSP